ncbi:MAG: hypothetical protein LBL15_06445 [Oscillospiraceae bacterium]|nr:hypothetical protein [Oscillospiraceae bacterium]
MQNLQTKDLVGRMPTKIDASRLTLASSAKDKILLPYYGELTTDMLEHAYMISMRSPPPNEKVGDDFIPYERVVKNVRVNICFHLGTRVYGAIAHLFITPVYGKPVKNKLIIKLDNGLFEQILEQYFNNSTGLTQDYENMYRSRFLKWKAKKWKKVL